MDERYEIGKKLGQGGLGSVYAARDTRMNRDVAIKRIFSNDDEKQKEEAIRQMTQETGTLAMLQHPHIVTIYDVGADQEGPYVIMELLKGKTVDEIVEQAPLTWQDFREFALQVQEGLIAAQDLGLVHRDLKPTNIMLNWLPSGKFQVKIVDFGLAKFSPKPSLQTVDHNDSVYGSIFFMSPEQFERVPLDARCDMYAIGCVYYFSLAGVTPFQGDTGPQVMGAHLEHRVVPLHELRPDLPRWVCDWIMWHINRKPEERPENARDALQSFLELDTAHGSSTGPVGSLSETSGWGGAAASRLIIPGTSPVGDHADGAAVPGTAAQPALAPTAGQPVRAGHTTAAGVSPVTTQTRLASANPGKGVRIGGRFIPMPALVTLAIVLLALVGLGAHLLTQRAKDNQATERYNALVREAAFPTTEELAVTGSDLDLLLQSVRSGGNQSRETVYKALAIAKASDGTPVDTTIAGFATTRPLPDDIRAALLTRVLRHRQSAEIVPMLLDYAREVESPTVSAAAVTAVSEVSSDEHLAALLDILQFRTSPEIRRAAESALTAVIRKSDQRRQHAPLLTTAYRNSVNESTRLALLRLLGSVGGEDASLVVREALEGDQRSDTLAAIEAMKAWPDDTMFHKLVDFMEIQTDEDLRRRSFDAAFAYLTDPDLRREPGRDEEFWRLLGSVARSEREQLSVINGLARNRTEDWAVEILRGYTDPRNSDRVVDRAEKAMVHVEDQRGG